MGISALEKASAATGEVSREFATMLTNAFGIVAALAWSDALKNSFSKLEVFKTWPFIGPFVFASVITLLAYVTSRLLGKFTKKPCTTLCDPTKKS